jgi:hypothetical protein
LLIVAFKQGMKEIAKAKNRGKNGGTDAAGDSLT